MRGLGKSAQVQRLWLAVAVAIGATVVVTFREMRPEATAAVAAAERFGDPDNAAASPSPNETVRATLQSAVAPAQRAPNAAPDTGNLTSATAAPPIDHDHALDLIADLVARQKVGAGDSADDRWRREFDAAPLNPALTTELRSALDTAFADLSDDMRSHLIVGDVACRAADCEVLAVVNGAIDRQAQSGAWEAYAVFGIGDLIERVGRTPWSTRGLSITYEERRAGDDGYLVYRVVFRSIKAK